MAMMTLKISLGIFFARIIIKPWQTGLIYINVGVNVFSSAAAFFYVLFRCGPNLDDYVMQQLMNKCTPRTLDRFIAYQQAAITTLTDIIFVTLPIFILWNANMSRRSKLSVGFILCLAALFVFPFPLLINQLMHPSGVICSILRFRYVDGLTDTDDFFWSATNISTWSTIECGASIIAGCLATLRPFFKRMITNARDSSALSTCVKHVSRSWKSSTPSQASSLPHASADVIKEAKDTRAVTATNEHAQTFVEFLARPGEEVIQLSEQKRRESTEPILGKHEDGVSEFAWPVGASPNRKRQTIHASWTMRRGVASDGRTAGNVV
jgi:hypothetical protein